MTVRAILSNVLAPLDGDAFAAILADEAHEAEHRQKAADALKLLGDRLVASAIGRAATLLDSRLSSMLLNVKAFRHSFVQHPGFRKAITQELLTRFACAQLIFGHERVFNHSYQYFGRVRTDTLFLAPVTMASIMRIQGVLIPTGED